MSSSTISIENEGRKILEVLSTRAFSKQISRAKLNLTPGILLETLLVLKDRRCATRPVPGCRAQHLLPVLCFSYSVGANVSIVVRSHICFCLHLYFVIISQTARDRLVVPFTRKSTFFGQLNSTLTCYVQANSQ